MGQKAQGVTYALMQPNTCVYNIDRTQNSAGSITHTVELIVKFQGHHEKIMAEVIDLGKKHVYPGILLAKMPQSRY